MNETRKRAQCLQVFAQDYNLDVSLLKVCKIASETLYAILERRGYEWIETTGWRKRPLPQYLQRYARKERNA